MKFDLVSVENLGVKCATDPTFHIVVLIMRWIRQSLQHCLITPRTTAILWRASSFPIGTRDRSLGITVNDVSQHNIVNPIVPEVVHISHPVPNVVEVLRYRHRPACDRLPATHEFFLNRYSNLPTTIVVMFVDRKERMQMVVQPSHGVLNCDVQIPKRVAARHLYLAPDRGRNVAQFDPKSKNIPFPRFFDCSLHAIIR